jgi:DNA-binding NarL/FixJ family response regulator
MQGQSAIWVIASKRNTGERIGEMLREVRLLNPSIFIETQEELKAVLYPGCSAPQLVFLHLGLGEDLVAHVLNCLRELGFESRAIAVVNGENEQQLDRVYEAGVKTYLREGFSFADLLERARTLGVGFAIGRSK